MQDTIRPIAIAFDAPNASPRVSIAAVWRETLATLGAQSVPVLVCAFAGFALANILSALLVAVYTFGLYARTGTVLASYGPTRDMPLLVQGAVGMLAGALARGAISWLALRSGDRAGTLGAAARAALARLPALLITSLLAGGLILLGNLGLTELLRELQLDMTDMSRLSFGLEGMARSMGLRTLNDLFPKPSSPFIEWLSYFRTETTSMATTLVYAGGFSFYRVTAFDALPLPWLVGSASVAVLVATDGLLRFVTVSLMGAPTRHPITAVLGALRVARRRFRTVLTHVWLVRLSLLVLGALFVTVPLVLVQNILVPLLVRGTGSAWLFLAANMLLSISLALVSMLFDAFVVVYDARLYQALKD
jgi:hypothetical protein